MRNTKTKRLFKARGMLAIVFILMSTLVLAQTKTVTGTVVDENGEGVIGAAVSVRGTTTGTITDLDGNYSIDARAQDVLVIKFVGYIEQSITVGNQNRINVVLKEDTQLLDEVVVVGYGVQKKSDVTGALAVVSSKDLTTKPVTNAFEALQGKVAGVDITTSQRPGELGSIRIRGSRSLSATNDPLYVVDGVVLSSGGIESINPRDIDNISVLKDASSTAIYGSRGANGVILITTKRGKEGQFQLNYSGTFTFEKIHDLQPGMSASDYITWRRWAYHNANSADFNPGNQPDETQDSKVFDSLDQTSKNNIAKGWVNGTWDASRVTNTDWTDYVTQTGVTQEHTLSASGGTDRMKSFFSLGYLKNEGTQKGQSIERYNVAMSTDIKATKWFTMGGSINASWNKQNYGFSRTGQSSNSGPTDIYNAAKQVLNLSLPYDENGEIIYTPGNITGVYTVIDEWTKSEERRQTFRALGSFYGNIDFGNIWEPLSGLNLKSNFGPDYRYYRRGVYLDKNSAVRQGGTSYAAWNYERRFSWVLDNMLTYAKAINDHKFDITLLQSASKYNYENASMSEQNVPKASYRWNNMGAVDITSSDAKAAMGTGLTESQLASYMARLNYSYKDRYLVTLSGRYDGSSVLSEGNKWSFFPSAALGWRVDQESFMQELFWLNQLKLRLGFGKTGNSAIDPYDTLGNIRSFYVPFGPNNVLAYGTNEPYYFATATLMANPNLKWEITTQYNLGIDFSLLKGRIYGAIDFYKSNTKDLLMEMNIPTLTGYGATMANIGKTKSKGIDISLNVIPVQTKDFVWSSSINAAWQKGEIEELAYGKNDMVSNSWFIGEALGVHYGFDNEGLWQESDAAEMAKFNENGHTFQVGMIKPKDQNGDYQIKAEDDRVILGNKDPRWTLGWSNTFNYKGIELNIELYGRFGYMVSTGGEAQSGLTNQRKIDYWRPDNTGAEFQKPYYTGTPGVSGDAYSSLLGFQKASYLKFRNVSLGYFLPDKICKAAGISSVKVFSQLRNPGYLYSSIDYLDLDYNTSYYNRGITFGIEIGF